MKTQCKFLMMITTILAIATIQLKAETKEPDKPSAEATKADSFDTLYELRIEYFTKSVKIYESVKDEASAQQAAKDMKGLGKLSAEIKRMTKALGQPDATQYAEMNKKYGNQLQELSTRMMKASYAFASKPYGKHIHRAQLQMAADEGDKDAAMALKMMDDPNAMKAFEDKQRAEKERAEKKISPEARKAGDEWIAAIQAFEKELKGLKDEAAAKQALPKLKTLVSDMEAKAEASRKIDGASEYIYLNRSKLLSSVMVIGTKGAEFSKSSDKELQGVMSRAFQQISH